MAGRLVKSANSAAVPVMSTTAPYLLRSPCTQKITNTHSDIRKPPIGCLSGKRLPKVGWVGYRKSQNIIGTIKNVTVIRRGEKWDVSIQTEYDNIPPETTPSEVGIDMGVKRFATLSNGEFFEPISPFKREQEKLAKLQRKLARQKKESRNSRKTKRKIARLYRHIADSRRDFLHKTSTQIAQNHSTVFVEDLKVSNMSASAAGTKENPGKKVKQKNGVMALRRTGKRKPLLRVFTAVTMQTRIWSEQ